MKTELLNKHPFTIPEKKKSKSVTINENKDKEKIIGYYDDIEKQDIKIKNIKKQINRIKSATIKEYVYTNKAIPNQWKKKLGYQNQVLRLFSKDEKFLIYVGRGNPSNNSNNNININNNINNNIKNYNNINNSNNEFNETKSTMYKTSNSFLNKKNLNEDDKNSLNNNIQMISNKSNNKKKIILPEEEIKGKVTNIIGNKFHKIRMKKRKSYSEKEIKSILEDFKNLYPLKETMKSIIIEKEKENKIKQENFSKTFTDKFNNNIINNNTIKNNNEKSNFQKMRKIERQEAFRYNIFNKIIPQNYRTQSVKQKRTKKIIKFDNSNFGPFLNSNSESFYKKIEIKNPIVKKNLENINFYGPYYSYCPPCGNKNKEFYNKMDQENAIDLIQFIKKSRENNIFNHDYNKEKYRKSRQNKNYFNSYNLYSNINDYSNTFNSNRSSLKNFE